MTRCQEFFGFYHKSTHSTTWRDANCSHSQVLRNYDRWKGYITQHLPHLQNKIKSIASRWMPTREVSPEIRRILWNSLVRPFFEYIAPVLQFQTLSLQHKVSTKFKGSFKKFLFFPKSLKDTLLADFLGDLPSYGRWKTGEIIRRWSRTYPELGQVTMVVERPVISRGMAHIPKQLIDVLRKINFIQCKCGTGRITMKHMISVHGCQVNLDNEIEFWLQTAPRVPQSRHLGHIDRLNDTLSLIQQLTGTSP